MPHRNDDALAGAILETVRLPLLALGVDLRVETANDAFLRQFRVSREETVGQLVYDLGNGQWDIPELRRLLGEILPEKTTVSDYRVEHEFERIGRRIMHVDGRRIPRSGAPDLILLAISDDTEREALRAELVGRIEMADKLIDSVREGLLILDPDLCVRSASGSFYETFNVKPAETEGRLVYELGNGQWDIPELRQLLEYVLPRQRSFDDYEVTHTFEGLGRRVMVLNGRRLDHQDLILLAIRDVTDSRESAARLKEVGRAAHVGVFEVNLSDGTSDWSPEMRDILGYPQDAPPPPPGTVPEFVHPEDRQAVAAAYEKLLDPGGDGNIFHEHRIVRPDGEVRWVRMHGQTDFDEGGGKRPARLRGVVLDISEAKRAEAARRRTYSILDGIASGTQGLIAALDSEFRLLYANAAYLREYKKLWGHDLGLGENLLEPMARWPDEQEKAREIWTRALSGETFNIVMEFGPSKEYERVYDLRFSPLRAEQGRPSGAAHILHDITDQKRAEAALQDSEQRHALLLKVSDALRAEPTADAIAGRALRMLCDELQLDRCYVGIYRLAEDRGEFPYQVGNARVPPLPDSVRLSDVPDALRVAFERTLVVEDITKTEDLPDDDRKNLLGLGLRSLVAASIRKGEGNPIWSIVAVSADPRRWDPGEVALIEEVTERAWAAIERVRAEAGLIESEDRLRTVLESIGEAFYVLDRNWHFQFASRSALEWWGKGADAILGRHVLECFPESADSDVYRATRRVMQSRTAERLETMSRVLGRWIEADVAPTALGGVSVAMRDIDSRKRSEQHQTMLMAELDHRVKNVLALVQSIARQSLRASDLTGTEAADRFIGRVSALAQSHVLLATSRWEGASLRQLVENALEPYRERRVTRVSMEGPDPDVTPRAAQTLTLALHELVTNAAKYGALSNREGRVTAKWHLEGDGDDAQLVFNWTESGGPPIEEPPTRRGFGSRLIEQTLEFELSGRAVLDFASAGLKATFTVPLRNIQATRAGHGGARRLRTAPRSGGGPGLDGKRVLVVEDDHLIASELKEALVAAGCRVVGPVPSLSRALRAAESEELDAAVLDVNLAGEMVWPAAQLLKSRGIPFVFATGYSGTITPPLELAATPWIEKPVNTKKLVSVLARLCAKVN